MAPLEEFVAAGGEGTAVPSVVLLPGWATDSRVFGGIFPGVAAVRVSGALRVEGFADRLAAFLDDAAAAPVTVLGWSLGGFLAAEFAGRHPSRVRRLILTGVRRRYLPSDVEPVRAAFLRDRRACLSSFYAQCFFPSRMREYRLFRRGLQEEYIRDMDADALLSGLDYLERAVFPAGSDLFCPVEIIHGGKDAVAPAAEAQELARSIGRAAFRLLPEAPHAAFLDGGFSAFAPDG